MSSKYQTRSLVAVFFLSKIPNENHIFTIEIILLQEETFLKGFLIQVTN